MPLKIDFNNQLSNFTKFPTELQCVNALINTLQSYYPYVKAKRVHGKISQFNTGNGRIQREICDIFLILRYSDHYRFSFIQNKREVSHYSGLSNFNINAGQHYFLVKKPRFSYNKKSYSLLQKGVYDTITAYSVFYKDSCGLYNFDFASAISCICAKQNAFCCCNFTEKCNTNHYYTQVTHHNNNPKVDYVSLSNADEIESYPYFGEVIDFADVRMREFKTLISDCAGTEMLDFLEMGNIDNKDFITDYDDISNSIQLIIKNIVAIDLRNL